MDSDPTFLEAVATEPAPPHGFRHAGLMAAISGGRIRRIGFSSLNRDDIFGVNEKARCRFHDHPAPDEDCTCGFYALVSRPEITAAKYSGFRPLPHLVLLEVSMYGSVLEGAAGLRGGGQLVTGVAYRRTCRTPEVVCPNETSWLAADRSQVTIMPGEDWAPLYPVCDVHAEEFSHRIRPVEVELLAGVELVPDRILDPVSRPRPDLRVLGVSSAAAVVAGTTAGAAVSSSSVSWVDRPSGLAFEVGLVVALIMLLGWLVSRVGPRSPVRVAPSGWLAAASLALLGAFWSAPSGWLGGLVVAGLLVAAGWWFAVVGRRNGEPLGLGVLLSGRSARLRGLRCLVAATGLAVSVLAAPATHPVLMLAAPEELSVVSSELSPPDWRFLHGSASSPGRVSAGWTVAPSEPRVVYTLDVSGWCWRAVVGSSSLSSLPVGSSGSCGPSLFGDLVNASQADRGLLSR